MFSFTTVLPLLNTVIDRVFPDKEKQAQARAEMMTIIAEAEAKQYEAKGKIISAEAQGESWLQRNWRPISMVVFLSVIVNNFILVPYLAAFGVVIPALPVADAMWGLLTVGIGGYIGGRSFEKVQKLKLDRKVLFDELRDNYGSLSQNDVDIVNEALRKSMGK